MSRQQFFWQMCAQKVRKRQRDDPSHEARRNPLRELMNQDGKRKGKPSHIRNLAEHCRPWSFCRKKEEVYPQRLMVEQPKNNISDLQFETFPAPSTFQYLKTGVKTEVCVCLFQSPLGSNALDKKKVAMATSVDDLKTSRSIFGSTFPNIETLDAKIITALRKIIQKSNIRKVYLEEQKARTDDRIPSRKTHSIHDV